MIEVLIFRIDQFSFWVGFVAGIIFAWLLGLAWKAAPTVLRFLRSQFELARESLTTGTENRMRQDVLQWAQKQHLAAPLFSLNEIIVPPRLLNPPDFTQTESDLFQDAASMAIPYMPDWPELAANYGAQTMSLPQALQKGANLVIIGQPGSGKTVALADLASRIARRDPELGELAALFPLFIPAPALWTHLKVKEVSDALIQAMAGCYASPITLPRLKNVLKYLLQAGRVLLLLDGLDELSPKAMDDIKNYVLALLQEYPKLRLVIAASPGDFGKLQALKLAPLAMAGWSGKEKTDFIRRWQSQWNNFITGDELTGETFVDSLLLVQWLAQKEVANSPFETTLKTWGAFAGDILGPGSPDLIYAHLRRLSSGFSNAFPALEALAKTMIEHVSPTLHAREAENAIAQSLKSHPAETVSATLESQPLANKPLQEAMVKPGSASQLLSAFLGSGIIISYGSSQVAFAHPYFLGYLAGRAFAGADILEQSEKQPEWTGWLATLGFLGCFGNISPVIEKMLDLGRQTPVHRQSFQAARWLHIAPPAAQWRSEVIRYLLEILQREYETLSLSGRALTALILANDPGIATALRQLTKSNQPNIRQLAALGLGLVGDNKVTETLALLVDDVTPGVMRAALLSLVAVGTKDSIDAVITVLLNHSEEARRAAAEALANHPSEGFDILKEGIGMDDLLVRRAVIYGMMRTKNPEFLAILEKTAIEDAQWVVRNAASQALELMKTSSLNIPSREPSLVNQSWLIDFAAKSGIGVGDPNQAAELVLQALERGEPLERMKALENLRLNAKDDAVPPLYHLYFGSQAETREACFNVLWHIATSNVNLPSPVQFGLG